MKELVERRIGQECFYGGFLFLDGRKVTFLCPEIKPRSKCVLSPPTLRG